MINEKKLYQAFYTKSTPIVEYMLKSLHLKTTDKIFEPCGGDGVFIEAILDENSFAHIDVYELNSLAIQILNEKFNSFPNIKIQQKDTLLDDDLIFNSEFGGVYDKIVANPPYGAWQGYDKRDTLKKMYPGIYTKETYSLFLYRCVELLKEDGILSFIIPDTFLNIHMHKSLRKYILENTQIVELLLFPSSFFPGINFGYANLSIITLKKSSTKVKNLNHQFNILSGFTNVSQLANLPNEEIRVFPFFQKEILSNPDHAFFISDNSTITNLINNSREKIGDVANCVTGFYSGNDKKFLRPVNFSLKNAKNYELVEPNKVCLDNYVEDPNILNGIEGERHFIPIVKGGKTKYLKADCWFMDWGKDAVEHYKTDSKARFQNPKYYFQFGIGVPMISSSSITASLIENKLFDQSIVGIFPREKALTYYLLAFFNSTTCNKLIRTINPSANNPANYIKKIPFIRPNVEQLGRIDQLVLEIINSIKSVGQYQANLEETLDRVILEIYGF